MTENEDDLEEDRRRVLRRRLPRTDIQTYTQTHTFTYVMIDLDRKFPTSRMRKDCLFVRSDTKINFF